MPLFRLRGKEVERILPQDQRIREDAIHSMIEKNLSKFFGDLLFVAHKPRIGGKEFDTLALNKLTNAPVIVEYKREKDRGVVEQVSLYYVKLKNNIPDVMILLQDVIDDLNDIDFENPQIIVVAKEFSREQRELLSLMSRYLRLFRYQLYAGNLISLEAVEPLGSTGHLATARSGRGTSSPSYEIDHYGMKPAVLNVYKRLDSEIMALDSRIKPGKINKYFVGYGATGSYFCSVKPRVNFLTVEVKCVRKPPSVRGLKIQKRPEYRTMTHSFKVSSVPQIPPALKVIKIALDDSM